MGLDPLVAQSRGIHALEDLERYISALLPHVSQGRSRTGGHELRSLRIETCFRDSRI